MSPEQVRGQRPSPSMDIYSLGIIAYECLNGKVPFFTGAIDYQIIHEQPPRIAGLPNDINDLLQQVLAKEAKDRPQTAGQWITQLKNPSAEAVSTPRPPEPVVRPSPQRSTPPRSDPQKLSWFNTTHWDRFDPSVKRLCFEPLG